MRIAHMRIMCTPPCARARAWRRYSSAASSCSRRSSRSSLVATESQPLLLGDAPGAAAARTPLRPHVARRVASGGHAAADDGSHSKGSAGRKLPRRKVRAGAPRARAHAARAWCTCAWCMRVVHLSAWRLCMRHGQVRRSSECNADDAAAPGAEVLHRASHMIASQLVANAAAEAGGATGGSRLWRLCCSGRAAALLILTLCLAIGSRVALMDPSELFTSGHAQPSSLPLAAGVVEPAHDPHPAVE